MRDLAAWTWLTLLLVAQPIAAFRGRAGLDRRRRPRLRVYRGSAAGIGVIGLVSVAVDAVTRGEAMAATLLPLSLRSLLGWSGAVVAGMVGFWLLIQVVRRRAGSAPRPALLHLLPRTSAERAAFAGLSLLAGACEEFAFRGFCLFELRHLTGSLAVAAVLTTVGFGMGHAYQGAAGVVRTTLAGAILVLPVLATGSLVPSMVGHATLDLAQGSGTLPLLRRWGVVGAGIDAPPSG